MIRNFASREYSVAAMRAAGIILGVAFLIWLGWLAYSADQAGILSNGVRDVFAILGVISAVLTAVGLWVGWRALLLTIKQMEQSAAAAKHAASVAEEARDAAIRATNETRDQYNRYVGLHASGLVSEAKHFVLNEDFRLAALRLHDLAELIMHISSTDETWQAFSKRLRQMEDTFNGVANGYPQFETVESKWRKLHLEIAIAISKHYGPFQPTDGEQGQ